MYRVSRADWLLFCSLNIQIWDHIIQTEPEVVNVLIPCRSSAFSRHTLLSFHTEYLIRTTGWNCVSKNLTARVNQIKCWYITCLRKIITRELWLLFKFEFFIFFFCCVRTGNHTMGIFLPCFAHVVWFIRCLMATAKYFVSPKSGQVNGNILLPCKIVSRICH